MKKLFKTLALSLVAASFMTGVASAQASVSNTGPNSDVTITSNQKCKVSVNNATNIGFVSNNNQSANSGDAAVSGNTTGGAAATGSATNTSSVSASFTVINSAPTTSGSGTNCPPAGTTATPTTPVTPVNPGSTAPSPVRPSGGVGAGGVVAAASTISALPETGSNNIMGLLYSSVALAGSLAVATHLGLKAYKRTL